MEKLADISTFEKVAGQPFGPVDVHVFNSWTQPSPALEQFWKMLDQCVVSHWEKDVTVEKDGEEAYKEMLRQPLIYADSVKKQLRQADQENPDIPDDCYDQYMGCIQAFERHFREKLQRIW